MRKDRGGRLRDHERRTVLHRGYEVKKADVVLGKRYLAKVSGKIVTVVPYYKTVDRGWFATNCATGRTIRVKTAARLREIREEGNRG